MQNKRLALLLGLIIACNNGYSKSGIERKKFHAPQKTAEHKKTGSERVHKVLVSSSTAPVAPKNAELEDCIVAVIYCQQGNPIVLTKKDFERVSINGVLRSKEEIIKAHQMAYYAREVYKMNVPDEMIEKYIQGIMDQNGLTRDQIKSMFENVGYTFQEGIDQLKMMYLIDNLLNYKIKSRIVIPEEKIQTYVTEHPEEVHSIYELQSGTIAARDITDQQVEDWDHVKATFESITWSDSYSLQDDEISENRSFIKKLPIGTISDLEDVSGGYEVIRLLNIRKKDPKNSDQQRKEAIEALRAPLYEKLLADFEKEMTKDFEVVFLD